MKSSRFLPLHAWIVMWFRQGLMIYGQVAVTMPGSVFPSPDLVSTLFKTLPSGFPENFPPMISEYPVPNELLYPCGGFIPFWELLGTGIEIRPSGYPMPYDPVSSGAPFPPLISMTSIEQPVPSGAPLASSLEPLPTDAISSTEPSPTFDFPCYLYLGNSGGLVPTPSLPFPNVPICDSSRCPTCPTIESDILESDILGAVKIFSEGLIFAGRVIGQGRDNGCVKNYKVVIKNMIRGCAASSSMRLSVR
eukprot:CAMPEP_0184687538 /NCGR_PEP_ID=MMETSP0312-20130426/26784_1 /TAXON_ID=31354 /ORGANISM="Compsopogon coeruleus, Strain SAG 36.94" /LENGTH=248 /DNA_ID=CAMNT_0027143799 /DNA_START=70 /DNA_END=813 /DNA_ORIENTATION=-